MKVYSPSVVRLAGRGDEKLGAKKLGLEKGKVEMAKADPKLQEVRESKPVGGTEKLSRSDR